MSLEMFVKKVAFDEFNGSPVVLLSDMTQTINIPIYIGLMEAFSIAVHLDKIAIGRPLTHDLMKNMLEQLGVKVKSIEITELKDNIYYAVINLESNGKEISVDARPSDSIALAIRCGVPIYLNEQVINETNTLTSPDTLKNFWQTFADLKDPTDKE